MTLLEQAKQAKAASRGIAGCPLAVRDAALLAMADALVKNIDYILSENELDVAHAAAQNRPAAMRDRLRLNAPRVKAMAEGLRQVVALPDPIGGEDCAVRRPNGLIIGRRRVPLGVVGIIYEARPNVTSDAIGLLVKSGNAAFLRGGSEAIHSNIAVAEVMCAAAYGAGLPEGCIQLVTDTSREAAEGMMRLNGYLDVLIPRGGASLIQSVVKNATVPVIETGVGNCHTYVEATADKDMAVNIICNAKVSRPAVCNAMETLLIDESAATAFLADIAAQLLTHGVELRGCERARALIPQMTEAAEADWETEYNDLTLAVRVVDGMDDALEHIARYGTGHSECIVTNDYRASERFLDEVDAAAVYVNASTRFTDGEEFGFGAEIGISTQKMHARGPMGLNALTSVKYIVRGNGQIR